MCTATLAVVGSVLGAYMGARNQQAQYEAAAKQSEYSARVQEINSNHLMSQGEDLAKNSAANQEAKRRKLLALQGQQRAALGASGVEASGSALSVMGDSLWDQEYDLATDSYNNRQQVGKYFAESNNSDMQAANYRKSASDYRDAGKKAFKNTLLQGGLMMASSLYSPKSTGRQSAGDGISSRGWAVGKGFNYRTNPYSFKQPLNNYGQMVK